MSIHTGARRRYRIILRGECQHLLAGVPGELSIESCQGWTCVMASVRDESEFYGLLERFQDFALHIVSLNELGTESGLDARTHALVRLAALMTADAPGTTFDQHLATALDHGVTLEEIIGTARVTAVAPQLRESLDRVAAGIRPAHSPD